MAGLAARRRSGRKRIFELRAEQLAIVHQHLKKISRQWDDALSRLAAHVEDKKEQR